MRPEEIARGARALESEKPCAEATLFVRDGREVVRQPADVVPREPARLAAWLRARGAALGR